MNKIIRWPGLVGFLVIVVLLATVFIVFLDSWVKLAATKGLEHATGAEVNIAAVSHTLSPFGITLKDVQLTDPKKPTHNQVQATEVTAFIELAPLLLNKVIVDDMTITGLVLSQPRETEGKVYREPGTIMQQINPFDSQNIPTIDEVLARSPLKTTQAITDVQQAYDRHSESLKNQYQSLPNKEKLKQYKIKIKSLTETDYKDPIKLAAAKKDFDQLRRDLAEDKQKIKAFQQAAKEAKTDLQPKLTSLQSAPGEDIQKIQQVVAGDQAAINDVTRMMLGEKAALWSDYLLSAYHVAGPLLKKNPEQQQASRDKGQYIAFSDEVNLPDIWIKKANISLQWQQETIASTWTDITHQHDKIDRPTRFNINSTGGALWQSLVVNGDFSISDIGLTASQDWDLQGIKLKQLALVKEQKLTTQIETALMASSGRLSINNDQLTGLAQIDFEQLKMRAQGTNNFTQVVAQTLASLNTLNIQTDISGTVDSPRLSFNSDLDKQLGKGLISNLSDDQQGKLNQLKEKLDKQVQDVLGEKNKQLSQWIDWEELAKGDLDNVESMLASQFNSVLEQQKDKLKDKLRDKLFGN